MFNRRNASLLTNVVAMGNRSNTRTPSARPSARIRRRGVAAVEFGVCLPVIVLLVFGAIEASSFIFLKQTLGVAGYETIREAIKDDATNATAIARGQAILVSRQVNDFQISFPSGDVSSIERGDLVVCEVSAPTVSNSPLAGEFVPNRLLTTRVVMVKE
jgi:hypothetical protein